MYCSIITNEQIIFNKNLFKTEKKKFQMNFSYTDSFLHQDVIYNNIIIDVATALIFSLGAINRFLALFSSSEKRRLCYRRVRPSVRL